MDYIIEYWKEKEANPIEFLKHFRCTTETIGGGTEPDAEGELVNYDAALTAIDLTKKHLAEKACKWLKLNTNWDDEWDEMGRNMNYGKIEELLKAMEE